MSPTERRHRERLASWSRAAVIIVGTLALLTGLQFALLFCTLPVILPAPVAKPAPIATGPAFTQNARREDWGRK